MGAMKRLWEQERSEALRRAAERAEMDSDTGYETWLDRLESDTWPEGGPQTSTEDFTPSAL